MSVACTRVVSSWVWAWATSDFGRGAALEAIRRQAQGRLEGLHRLVQELLLRVGGPQLEVVDRQLGLQAEPGGLQIGGGGLGLVAGRRHRPPDPAPQVDLVRHVERQEEVAGAAGAAAGRQERLVAGLADGAGAERSVEIVGNSAARLKRTTARASRSLASATFRSWLAAATCSSSAWSSGSSKISHHGPRGR